MNDVVIINLDRPRELRFGHKALKTLTAITGTDIESLTSSDSIKPDDLEKFMYCGLLSDARASGETLTLEGMEDLLDRAPSYTHMLEKLTEAMHKAFGNSADPEGNEPAAPEQKVQRKK